MEAPDEFRVAVRGQVVRMVEDGIRAMITMAGDDPNRPGLAETPARWLKAMLELVGPDPDEDAPDAATLMGRTFPDIHTAGEAITVGPIPFRTVCEHHLLPFTGSAWIAYTPAGGRVVGLSKLPRLVALHARALNVQERFTTDLAVDIAGYLEPAGYSVGVIAEHSCTTLRGARATGTLMRTYAFGGTHNNPAERTRMDRLTGVA